jgi:hypothetical protein
MLPLMTGGQTLDVSGPTNPSFFAYPNDVTCFESVIRNDTAAMAIPGRLVRRLPAAADGDHSCLSTCDSRT